MLIATAARLTMHGIIIACPFQTPNHAVQATGRSPVPDLSRYADEHEIRNRCRQRRKDSDRVLKELVHRANADTCRWPAGRRAESSFSVHSLQPASQAVL